MKVLLTGATGFLGSEIARQLVAAGHEVRITVRKTSKLTGVETLPIEKVEADILDKPAMLRALDGVDALIHTAASVSMKPRDRDWIYQANVEGTRTVLTAALERGIKRVVYTSSVAAVGSTEEPRLLDENAAWDLDRMGLHYVIAKRRAEELALDLAKKGLPLVVLNPGSILGPGDVYLSSTKLILEYLTGTLGVYLDGGMTYCDVRDVAKAHVAALTKGRVGERYIVAGQNFTYAETYDAAARLSGLKRPRRIPRALAMAGAYLSEVWASIRPHRLEEFSRPVIRMGTTYNFMDVKKASSELGYAARPFEETLRDTIVDHVRRGLVQAKTPELLKLKDLPRAEAAPSIASAAPRREPALAGV